MVQVSTDAGKRTVTKDQDLVGRATLIIICINPPVSDNISTNEIVIFPCPWSKGSLP